ncbi:MAG: hypothetical protein QOK29_2554, partial [Rhodospirillaceae bacterium]|nr:hypothetical protein [Rhodospirillaceae bacterium]
MEPRALINDAMAAIYHRVQRAYRLRTDRPAREIMLGGGLSVTDITGRAVVDPHAVGLMLRFLDPGDTMIDVGAGVGIYSVLAGAMLGWRGRVDAFEPSPTLRPCLEENL